MGRRPGVTDIHLHVQPWKMFRPEALEKMRSRRKDLDQIINFTEHPKEFLRHLDACGIERAGVVNYVSPDIIGFTADVNDWVSKYCAEDSKRLLAVGSVHPKLTRNAAEDMDRLCGDLRIRILKIHPPHQLVAPNDYLSGLDSLRVIYEKAQDYEVPVMIHTGTSIFPGARNKYAHPMLCDDIGVDFPNLKVILAHGGRPLWMEECFFLIRRHPNFFMDVSGIPPTKLLEYFPRLEDIADKVMFGTDWPGPGVPGIRENLEAFEALSISESAKEKMLVTNAQIVVPSN